MSDNQASQSQLDIIVQETGAVVSMLIPIVEAADPAIASAVAIGAKIVAGAIALEPDAVALFNQIKGGKAPTAAQLAAFSTSYEAAYQQLNTDIAAKLAAVTAD